MQAFGEEVGGDSEQPCVCVWWASPWLNLDYIHVHAVLKINRVGYMYVGEVNRVIVTMGFN